MSLKVRANGSIKSQVKSKLFFTRKIDYPQPRAQYEPKTRTIKDPCIIQIRNKYTKELVDIEVRVVGLLGFVAYDSFLIRRPSSLCFLSLSAYILASIINPLPRYPCVITSLR